MTLISAILLTGGGSTPLLVPTPIIDSRRLQQADASPTVLQVCAVSIILLSHHFKNLGEMSVTFGSWKRL